MKHIALFGAISASVLYFASCSGGNGPIRPIDPSNDFLLLRTSPQNNGRAFLNDVVALDFSLPVDLDSATLDSVAFQVFDVFGNPSGQPMIGRFALDRSPGDVEVGRRLVFEPALPTNNTYTNGGLRPAQGYLVQLVGGHRQNGTALRSQSGRPLVAPVSFRFSTVEGTSPQELFRNPLAGGPRRTDTNGLTISGSSQVEDIALNLFGAPPVQIRLNFNQALNPHERNVPVLFDPNPVGRRQADRGLIFLEYEDPEHGPATWIPAEVELERNDRHGSTVLLRPVGVLPNNAEVRVIVESTVEDIAGESNVGDPSFDRVFGTFHTDDDYGQQWNGIVEEFVSRDTIDFDAVFAEPHAEVGPGYVRASFEFEGSSTTVNYHPSAAEVVLDTSFTQIVPATGLPFNVSGGVFKFHDVTIPQGVSVQGQGPNPMVWLCTGDFRVHGTLSVRGGDGERVSTLNSANFAKGGGVGRCGGGNGGDGSPSSTSRSLRGATGNGPLQAQGLGGGGGRLSCVTNCMNGDGGGSGGGGGTLATQGDPWYRSPAGAGTAFQQRAGIGGAGCSGLSGMRSAALAGGEAAPLVFIDARADNDFFGEAIDRNRNIRIRGEITVPVGGGGGGGGGDHAFNTSCSTTDPSFANDSSAGGGGGGGGVLIIKALGEIEVSSTGWITADGGDGGGGAWAGSCNRAGGGGGGAGGMVVLMSSTGIVLHAHGNATRWNYAQNDYDFCISADGGVCTTGGYAPTGGAWPIYGKYPASGQPVVTGSNYDLNPLGGLGGMGIVQLMAPVGSDNADQTNTLLDDNITVYRDGVLQEGAAKQSILAWRGFPDESGVFRDDFGNAVTIGNDEGDIRPTPQLMPAPFGARSRVRSKWIDTGASVRRALSAADDLPRGLVVTGTNVVGPVHEFEGLQVTGAAQGYVRHVPAGSGAVRVDYPVVVDPTGVERVEDATLGGEAVYRIALAAATLGPIADRYRQHEAELLGAAGEITGSFRIVAHTDRVLWVSAEVGLLPPVAERVRVVAKFFRIETDGAEGLGPLATNTVIPRANTRIGFAFHQDPTSPTGARYPESPLEFIHSMDDAGLLNWVQQNGTPRYVQWDITFDLAFAPGQSAGPGSPRPALDWLRIPFRF